MSIDPTTTHKAGSDKPTVRPPGQSRGHTTVKQKALVHVASQVAADTMGVRVDNVRVSVHDDGTRLGLSVETPLSKADMIRCSVRPDMTVFSLCENARRTISQRAEHITGHSIGGVDVVVAGVEKEPDNDRRVK